jgi:hypothetical protein
MRPTAFLKTHPCSTRVLVRGEGDDVLKAVLRPSYSPPHAQAIPRLLEALALWYQAPLHVVLSAHEADAWCLLGLVGGLGEPLDTLHYTVELRVPGRDRRRGRRIEGLGSFVDVRQLVLGGVR